MIALAAFPDWLSQTSISRTFASIEWIVPAIQTIHILAIGIIITSSALLDVRLAGWAERDQSMRSMANRFMPWFWCALIVLIATGTMLIIAEPSRELLNILFWTKMGIVLSVAILMFYTSGRLRDVTFAALTGRERVVLRSTAIISLFLILVVIWCGRWIGYTQ